MFNPSCYENSRPDGFGVMEIVDTGGPAQERLFVPLKRTELQGQIVGPLADLRLVQTFGYGREQCDKTLEAVYRFPLPGDAAVTGVLVRFGDVEIRAELKERQQAEADYAEARQQGKQAALATRESPDVFTLQVGGLRPDQEIQVETRYVQLARTEGKDWSVRVPLTTAPRYVREDERNTRHAQGQPLALLRDPGHRFRLDLIVRGAEAVISPTHTLTVTPEDDGVRVRLKDGEVLPDRDCLLQWQTVQDAQNPNLYVLLHDDPAANQTYFFAQITPPKSRAQPPSLVPREIVLLVDHSGSMQGAKWNASDWAVKRFLSDLTRQDSFALGLFHSDTRWFAPKTVAGDAQGVAAAVQFLETNRDSGGTNLGVALEQALHLKTASGERARHLLIVTDAEVSDSGRILQLASDESARLERRRISVLCIDAAPNATLATELAERGGGVARFLTSEPAEEDITTALDNLLEDWSAPVLSNLRLEVNRNDAEATGRKTLSRNPQGASAIDLGDLPMGRSVWVAGRVPRGESADLAFRALTPSGQVIAECRRDLAAPNATCPAIKALFGARRVQRLEYIMHADFPDRELMAQLAALGYDWQVILGGADTKRVYAENTLQQTAQLLRGLLVKEALEYGLASAETAFIAVRHEAGQPIEGTVAVANALPSGWSEAFAGPSYARSRHSSPHSAQRMMAAPSAAPMDALGVADAAIQFVAQADDVQQAISGLGALLEKFRRKPTSSGTSVRRLAASAYVPADYAPQGEITRGGAGPQLPLFKGVPVFQNGEAILFDSTRNEDSGRFTDNKTLSQLTVQFPKGTPDAASLGSDLMLLLYVDDPAMPQVRVRLADLARQGGVRPLNILYRVGQMLRVTLADPGGIWAKGAPIVWVLLQ